VELDDQGFVLTDVSLRLSVTARARSAPFINVSPDPFAAAICVTAERRFGDPCSHRTRFRGLRERAAQIR
jgi:hypothetical protein